MQDKYKYREGRWILTSKSPSSSQPSSQTHRSYRERKRGKHAVQLTELSLEGKEGEGPRGTCEGRFISVVGRGLADAAN